MSETGFLSNKQDPKTANSLRYCRQKLKKKQTLVFGFVWQDLSEEQESSEF